MELWKKDLYEKNFKRTSNVEDSCLVNIPEDTFKLENTEIQGNLDKLTFSLTIDAHM